MNGLADLDNYLFKPLFSICCIVLFCLFCFVLFCFVFCCCFFFNYFRFIHFRYTTRMMQLIWIRDIKIQESSPRASFKSSFMSCINDAMNSCQMHSPFDFVHLAHLKIEAKINMQLLMFIIIQVTIIRITIQKKLGIYIQIFILFHD